MQVTTLSFFRFQGPWNKFWAFQYMGLAKKPLRAQPGIGFLKMLGVGRYDGFHPAPNLGRYTILATWDSLEAAEAAVYRSDIFRRYRAHASEHWTVFLVAFRSQGTWDEVEPFARADDARASSPIAILTRATINRQQLRPFWQSVPRVTEFARSDVPGMRFKVGMGELPIVQLMTFSVWDDLESAKHFAYRGGEHRTTMRAARRDGWFEEELFVRFNVVGSTGSWDGTDPAEPAVNRRAAE
ncbi:MAG: spheroidene monooxygenase [Myxococcota bacterium]